MLSAREALRLDVLERICSNEQGLGVLRRFVLVSVLVSISVRVSGSRLRLRLRLGLGLRLVCVCIRVGAVVH